MKNKLILCLGVTLLAGCATGSQHYYPPKERLVNTTKTINKNYDTVWADAIPTLGKQFFVINNLDKASGLINLSYSGEAEKYIDCGTATSSVTNARGKRDYFYVGAAPYTEFEAFSPQMGLAFLQRKISLEGRINLILEKTGTDRTKVTTNTKYIVTREYKGRMVTGQYFQPSVDSVSFTNDQKGLFTPNANGQATTCVSKGTLEKAILDSIH